MKYVLSDCTLAFGEANFETDKKLIYFRHSKGIVLGKKPPSLKRVGFTCGLYGLYDFDITRAATKIA